MAFGYFFLEFFDQRVVELDDFSAPGADHVVMVAVHIVMLVAFLAIAEIQF